MRIGDNLWQVTASTQSCSDASIAPLASATRRQLTGLSAINPMRMENVDVRGNVAESWAEFDPETKVHTLFQRRKSGVCPLNRACGGGVAVVGWWR